MCNKRRRDLDLPAERETEAFYRNGEGDEVIFVHEGAGELETVFGTLPYRQHDYVVIPRGTTYRFRFDAGAAAAADASTRRARSRRRTATATATASCSSTRRSPSATSTRQSSSRRIATRGEFELIAPGARRPTSTTARLPPARRRGLGRLRLPVHVQHPRLRAADGPHPPAAAGAPDLPGPELRDLLVLPADARLGPEAVPLPYHHSNLQSEEMIYYVDGDFGSRKGVEVGCRSRCTPPACRTARSRGWSRRRSAPSAPRSWR